MATPIAIVFAATVASCGSDNNSTSSATSENSKINCVSAASVTGAGSSFVGPIVQQWVKDYQAACPGTVINYKGGGSGTGVQQFIAGTVDFAGTDVALTAKELSAAEAKYGSNKVTSIPWTAGGIALEYNLSGVTNLKLSAETVAKIFSGKVTKWNDPAIAADNAGATLPSTAIQVVKRSDGSGTTAAFSAYMAAAAPTIWTYGSGKEVEFPVGQGEKGSDGVTASVKQTDGAIGYAEVSYAKANSLSTAQIGNASGAYVKADDETAVSAALEDATVGSDGLVKLDYTTRNAKAYPISTVSYLLAPKVSPSTPNSQLVQSFVEYALAGGQAAAPSLGYASLPAAIANPAIGLADGLAGATPAATTTTAGS